PGTTDDVIEEASALGLPGAETATFTSVILPAPLHTALLTDDRFFDDFLAAALQSAPPGAGLLSGTFAPPRNRVALRSGASARVGLSAETPGKFSMDVTVGAADSASFAVFATEGEVQLTLTTPSGKLIDLGEAAASTRISAVVGAAEGGLSQARYTVVDPSPGVWTIAGDSSSSAFSFGKFAEVNELEAELELDGFSFAAGDEVGVQLTVEPASAAVSGTELSLLAPDGEGVEVVLSPVGGNVFTGSFTVPSRAGAVGRWSVEGQVAGSFEGAAFSRDAGLLFDVNEREVSTTGKFGSGLVEDETTGSVTALAVTVEVEVEQPGAYRLAGKLAAADGQPAGGASALFEPTEAGVQEVSLSFSAEGLAATGVSGKFSLTELVLANVTDAPVVVAVLEDVFETEAVDLSAFDVDAAPRLTITAPNADSPMASESFTLTWEDSDPDSDARISFFLDEDRVGFDGTPIEAAQDISEDDETDAILLDVSGLSEGRHEIYAVIRDGSNATAVYAPASLRVGLDSDGDGLLDSYELALGLDPTKHDSDLDSDGDGLTNAVEAELGTSPLERDTDFGGERDDREVRSGRDPLSPDDDLVLDFGTRLGDVSPRGAPDGDVSVGDVVTVLRFTVGLATPSDLEILRADLSPSVVIDDSSVPRLLRRIGDGRLDVGDVVAILRVSVGLTRHVDVP
ncbi:MAG: hypothetical protein O7B99_12715, partial [Planctomycetota bacterium]|nr:hypothetical protein [Planctomycetota bacterium]